MSGDRRYFKLWAAEALLSDDLDDLSDHERTVWLFAMAAASLEDPRWTVPITGRLAKKCKTTTPRLHAALTHMADLGMVELHDGDATFVNAHRWNEETERQPPSASREAAAARQQAKRDRDKASRRDVTTTRHVTRHDHKEEEEEKEKEEEKDGVTSHVTTAPPYLPARSGENGFGDRYGSLTAALGGRVNQSMSEEFTAMADAFSLDEILGAQRVCQRAGEKCFPSNLRKYLPREIPLVPNGHVPHPNDRLGLSLADRKAMGLS